jgi:conserved hypothetical integral membrane protein
MYQLIYLFGEAFLLYLLTGWVVWLSGRRGGDALLLTTGATYLFLLTMSQVLAVRLLDISPFMVPGGVLSYSASVAVLDIASVKYGARLGRWLVIIGAVLQLSYFIMLNLVSATPGTGGDGVLSTSARIAVASVTAFLISENIDVHLVTRLRLGVVRRVGVSDPIAMTIDSLVFIPTAFLGVLPTGVLLSLIIGQLIVKFSFVPLTMLTVGMNRKILGYGPMKTPTLSK